MPPLDDDDDLFDAPRPKPSNKIVYQPAGAQWSLDRLPEVESLYQSTFKKRLPLTNRGQGSIHNKWGYDHRNSADVSINPSTPEGQQFIEGLKKANVPFLAFSSAIPGVATGPHVHIGFPSKRTQQRFNVGSQKKSKSVASDDLFDTDDDLFDAGQTLPTPQNKAGVPSASPKQSKATSVPIEQALTSLTQQVTANMERVKRQAGRQPQPAPRSIFARPEVQQAVRQQQQPALVGSSNLGELRRADEPEVARIQRLQAEEARRDPLAAKIGSSRPAQRAARRASEEREDEARRQREAPELNRLTEEYRQQIREAARITPDYGPTKWFQEALHKGVGGLLELGAGATDVAKYNPLAYGAADAAERIRLHAEAMQRAAVEEGADRNVVSRTLQDATAGFISTAPELAAMSLGAPPIATFAAGSGARSYGRGERVSQIAKEAMHGAATGALFELPIPARLRSARARVAAKAGTVGGATTAMELATGTPAEQAIASGVTNAVFAGHGELSRGRRPSSLERGLAREAPRERVDPDAQIAARLRGQRGQGGESQSEFPVGSRWRNSAWSPEREPVTVVASDGPTITVERGGRREQMTFDDFQRYVQEGMIVREGGQREPQVQPESPVEAQRAAVESAAPRTEATTEGVLGNQPAGATGEANPRRFFHRDFGEVVESPNQRRVGKGRIRVVTEDGREPVIKRADMTGRGNQRAVPIKAEEVPIETAGAPPIRPLEAPAIQPKEVPESVQQRSAEELTPDQQVTARPSTTAGGVAARQAPPAETTAAGFKSDLSLSQFVRKMGGIAPGEMYRGELDRLRKRETGTTGLINQRAAQGNVRQTADIMMQAANDAGFRDPRTGQPFERPGDFLMAVERDVAGEKIRVRTGEEDFSAAETEYYVEQEARLRAAEARDVFLESGRGAELFDRIVDRKATDAERQEYIELAERSGISRAESEDLISAAREEIGDLQATRGERSTEPPQQLGFVQEGLTQESIPPRPSSQREALIQSERERQATLNPERTTSLARLEEIRRRGMTVDDYARQPDLLTGKPPSAEEIRALKEMERGEQASVPDQRELIRQKRPGEGGFAAVSAPAKTVGPVLREAQRAVQLEPSPVSKRIFAGIKRLPTTLQTALVSEFTPLRKLEEAVRGKDVVVDMARKFEQVAGAPAKAEADFIDFKRAVVDPIRQSADDFNAYLFLKRVEDRINKDPERKKVASWTAEKAQQGLKELEQSIGPETMARFENIGKTYQDEMNRALRLQVDSGRMSPELYDKIVSSNDFYAPFKVLKYIEQSEHGGGRNIATTQQLTKKITGIESEDFQVGNILQSSAEQIMRSRVLAEKNLKMQELAKLADTPNDLIKKVETDHHPRPSYEVVRYFENGKPQGLEVTADVAKAIHGLNASQAGAVAKAALIARRGLQWGATGANAGFQAVNLFFADLPRQALVSRYGLRSPKDIYRFPMDWAYSLATSMKGNFGKPNELFMEWLRSGAANSTIQRELTPEVFRPKPISPGRTHPVKRVVESVAQFSNAIEETSKILGLKRALRIEKVKDMTPDQRKAAMEKIAAELRNYSGSPDFLRKGSETRNLNLLFMFFNARLQGVTSDTRRLAGKSGKPEAAAAWARLGTLVGIPATALAVVNNLPQYKDDYDKIPDWEKKNYFMIPRESFFRNDDGEMVRDYWRVPKRDVVGLFGNSIESFVEFAAKREPATFKRFASSTLESLSPINIEGENLMERGESVAGSLNPLIKVPIETFSNRDFFRKRPIVPQYMQKVSPELQYRKSTPRAYRAAGRALGVSPLRLEHMAEGFTGSGVGQFNVREQPEGRSSATGYPIIRRFVRSGQVKQERGVSETERGVADKQLQRRQVRDEMIDRARRGEPIEVDEAVRSGELTESDRKQIQRDAKLSERQSRFADYIPASALDRYERMDSTQREEVRGQMETKAYTLLHSDSLTQEQKDGFAARIDALGITPRNPRTTSAGGFRSRLTGFRSAFRDAP